MHDIKFIRENPKIFDKKMNNRNVDNSSENILKIEGVNEVDLKLVWDPPWTKDKMSETAKLELNIWVVQ